MNNILGFAAALPLFLVILVSFFGVNVVDIQLAGLQEAKFIALESGAIAGGITPGIETVVETYLQGKGFDPDLIDWKGSSLVPDSGPFIPLNGDVFVVLSYPRRTLLDSALGFFGIGGSLPDKLAVAGVTKSQYVP